MELHHLFKIKNEKQQHIIDGWLYRIYAAESFFMVNFIDNFSYLVCFGIVMTKIQKID